MNIDWRVGPMTEWKADAILFFAFEKAEAFLPGLQRWLGGGGKWLVNSAGLADFRGTWQEVTVCYGPAEQAVPRFVCVGLGTTESFDLDKWRGAVASGLRKCRDLRLAQPALPIAALEGLPLTPAKALEEALIAGMLGIYRYDEFKTKDRDQLFQLEKIILLAEELPGDVFASCVPTSLAVVEGIRLARDLVTAPANRVTPAFLVETAHQLAAEHPFTLTVIDQKEAQVLGMGAFLAVAQGSQEPAYLIAIEYAPPGTAGDPPLVLVGKGITFDTGGISIKPSERMEMMKHDMAGAAAVLGGLMALARLKAGTRVIGLIPCTENMPDGKAYKPGDVIRSLSGLTIEVISTDAEGRMILCDALTFAQRFQPAAVIDLATLTGACIVALGDRVGAVMGNREPLTQKIQEIAALVGEKLWPLPLWDFYFDELKSDVADFKNVGSRKAGSIVGGMFLKQFVPDQCPWAHLDIAGPVWTDKDLPTVPKGATGFGVRILVELARQWPDLEIR
jgi:leucyl aminopeptidase